MSQGCVYFLQEHRSSLYIWAKRFVARTVTMMQSDVAFNGVRTPFSLLQWFRMVEHVTTRVGRHHTSTETFVLSYSAVWYKLSCVVMTNTICQPKNLP